MKQLLQSQRKFIDVSAKQQAIMIRQHKTIAQYKKLICQLRVLNRRREQKFDSTEEAKKSEKPKYTKDIMDQALKAVLKGESLSKAAKRFRRT